MKKLGSLLLTVILVVSFSFQVLAAESGLRFDGHDKGFSFGEGSEYSTSDLFGNFKDVMPGDSITEAITITNNAKNNVKIKLYMRSLGAQEETNELLSHMNLKVVQRSQSVLFDAPADQKGGLTEWTYLGTIYSGGEIILDVTLNVPIEMGNEFANEMGYIDWQFKVEEFPKEAGDPDPETGDAQPIQLYAGIMLVCVIFLIVVAVLKQKKNRQE